MASKYWQDLDSAKLAATHRWDAIIARTDVVAARKNGERLVSWGKGEPDSSSDYAALTLLHAHRLWVPLSRVTALAEKLQGLGARVFLSAEDARASECVVDRYSRPERAGLRDYVEFVGGRAARAGWVLFDMAEGAADGRFDLLNVLNDSEFAGTGPSLLFTHCGWDLGPFDNPRPCGPGGFPKVSSDAGSGVTVLISDSGWLPAGSGSAFQGLTPNDDTENPLNAAGDIAEAAYHGMFAGQLVGELAPGATVVESSVMLAGSRHLVDEAELLADLVRGIQTCPDPNKLVVNWSIAGHSGDLPTGPFDDVVTQLLNENKELIIVVSAGNDAVDCRNVRPAGLSHPRLVAVGATRQPPDWNPTTDPTPAGFSNYGSPVRVWTIGEHVVAEFPKGLAEWSDENGAAVVFSGYASWSGTSFAAPIIAAKIAVEFASVDALHAIRMVAPPQSDWNANTPLVQYNGSTAPYRAP